MHLLLVDRTYVRYSSDVQGGSNGVPGQGAEQERARELRAEGKTLLEIATELGVSKSSVSLRVRDVRSTPKPRQRPLFRSPSPLHLAKLAEIEEMNRLGAERIGAVTDEAFFAAGVALYAGEGAKTDGDVIFANTDTAMVRFFCLWFRRYFAVDESRLRVCVYLHVGLDLNAAEAHWSAVTGIPRSQFKKPYRAPADPSIRRNKHKHGCVYVRYRCAATHREIMGTIRALLSYEALPG